MPFILSIWKESESDPPDSDSILEHLETDAIKTAVELDGSKRNNILYVYVLSAFVRTYELLRAAFLLRKSKFLLSNHL